MVQIVAGSIGYLAVGFTVLAMMNEDENKEFGVVLQLLFWPLTVLSRLFGDKTNPRRIRQLEDEIAELRGQLSHDEDDEDD